jgi:hypothetical protein
MTMKKRVCSPSAGRNLVDVWDSVGEESSIFLPLTHVSLSALWLTGNTSATEAAAEQRKVYRSCARTKWDDEFLMVRLQLFCLLLGAWSFASLKKQKMATASLFDQRKQKRGGSHVPTGAIELGFVGNSNSRSSEETVPLTDNSADALEVV